MNTHKRLYLEFFFWQVFQENLAINLDPEKLMYLFIYLFIYLCTHLVGAVKDIVLMQK